jgi:thiol-disulfide isomerase/thioredoxin
MKNIWLVIFAVSIATITNAQTPYTTAPDEKTGGTILTGVINKYTLINHPNFNWYASSQQSYKPNVSIINAFEVAKSSIHFILFGGSWCDDTQFILPKFFKLQELSGFPDSSISFFGVDRDKKTLGNVSAAFQITNVPTIIVMKAGKEIGRVVEYGKTGNWESELMELIK